MSLFCRVFAYFLLAVVELLLTFPYLYCEVLKHG